jgi:sec-independent protein translocase protein TatC
MTFGDHLDELRTRLIRCILGTIAAAVVCFVFGDEILGFVLQPIHAVVSRHGGDLVWLRVQEGFLTYIKLSLVVGLFLASPWIAFQLWSFVSEGLYVHERKYVRLFAPATFVLFATGVLFCYFVVLPWGLEFLIAFSADVPIPGVAEGEPGAKPTISAGAYLSFFLTISILMGVVFQLPLLMIFLDRVGIVRVETFARLRRYFLVGAFILAALLTPPDPVTQIFVAVPIILLFESGILVCRFSGRHDDRPQPRAGEEDVTR